MEKRKILLIAAMFVLIEAFIFPELLFPDCIRLKNIEENGRWTDQEQKERICREAYEYDPWSGQAEQQNFEWRFWILSQ